MGDLDHLVHEAIATGYHFDAVLFCHKDTSAQNIFMEFNFSAWFLSVVMHIHMHVYMHMHIHMFMHIHMSDHASGCNLIVQFY